MMNVMWDLMRARGGRIVLGTLALAVVLASGVGAGRGPTAARTLPAQRLTEATTSGLTAQGVERQLLSVLSQVETLPVSATSATSGTAPAPSVNTTALLKQLAGLSAQLQGAEGVSRQIDNQNAALGLLLQARVDVGASIDKISADLQINLDQLEANVNATVNANVDASVGGITLTVKASADQIKADLGAQADRLLVDIKADLDVIKVVTLHARAHVDAQRLKVTLHALITKLNLDLAAVLRDLKVLAKADVKAALAASARLRANITAQVNGVRAQALAGADGRIRLRQATITALTNRLDGTLSSVSSSLTGIQRQLAGAV